MPKVRRHRVSPIAKIKNTVRGRTDRGLALQEVAATAPAELLPKLATWAASALRYDIFRGLEPNNLSDLEISNLGNLPNLERALLWCAAVLKAKTESVQAFIDLRNRFEAELLLGDSASCFRTLDEIDRRCGPSLWGISNRIGLLQVSNGIESQKEYVRSIYRSRAQKFVKFLCYWWSVRAENDISAFRFMSRIGKQLDVWELTTGPRAYIDYHFRSAFPSAGDELLLLQSIYSSNIIDFYQLFIDLAATTIVEERESAELFSATAASLLETFKDVRLEKVAVLGGRVEKFSYAQAAPTIFQNYRIDKARSVAVGVPHTLEEISAAALSGYEYEKRNAVISRLSQTLVDIELPGPTGVRAANELLKLGLIFSRTGLGLWCLAKALIEEEAALIPNPGLERLRFIGTDFIEPSSFTALPQAAKKLAIDNYIQKTDLAFLVGRIASGIAPINELPPYLASSLLVRELEIRTAILAERYEDALTAARKLNGHGGPTKLSLRAEIRSLLNLGRLEEATKTAVNWCLADTNLATWAPLEEIAFQLQASSNPFDFLIEKPILYDLLARHKDTGFSPQRAYACEDYLSSIGVDRPSQINFSSYEGDKRHLLYFLSEVCTASTLRLSIAYGSEKELEDEIILIFSRLSEIDAENAENYEEKARGIVRARLVREALKELQKSKVSIDEDALRVWCRRTLKEDFDRYVTLLKSGLAVVDSGYKDALIKAYSLGEYPDTLYEVPLNEAGSIFARLVSRVLFECIYNSEHGFDCYLSLRIRHGTLSGQLRGPVEQEKIVTRRDASSGSYKQNQHWRGVLSGTMNGHQLGDVLQRLSDFSRSYDAIISDVTDNLIQVQREDKPKGLFVFNIPELTIYGLATEIDENTSFDVFIGKCIEIFWTLAEEGLRSVRNYIDVVLRTRIKELLDNLESDFDELPAESISWLADAIRRVRTEVGLRLDAMLEWFEQPKPTNALPFSVEELVEVALATVKKFQPGFQPDVKISSDNVPALTGALHLFSDIFFILFENISLYSGDIRRPKIRVSFTSDDETVYVLVENELGPNVDLDHIEQKTAKARSIIDSDAYLSAVRKEGGTGLPKLAKLLRVGNDKPPLEFLVDREQREFRVRFQLQILTRAKSHDVQSAAVSS